MIKMGSIYQRSHAYTQLATLRHQRETTILFFPPVTSHIRMCEVVISDRLHMLNIDKLPKGARVYHFIKRLAVRRIPEDWNGMSAFRSIIMSDG